MIPRISMNVKNLLIFTWGVDITSILAYLSDIGDGAKLLFAILNGFLIIATGIYALKAKKAASLKAMIDLDDAGADRLKKMVEVMIELNLLKPGYTEDDLRNAIIRYREILNL